jgi:hypothetical protein
VVRDAWEKMLKGGKSLFAACQSKDDFDGPLSREQ